ncbi:D-alanyl-D-alanine carboxypeptidase [Streptomyces pharetrae CZA14]|uniref:serine-type D-Ala-D-Ala carboxypeptidase n=1 Tax=Streptomyces pharetrae CZA14 TaxID=1144883 RepID=A0ABX3YE20_9ACTN|nr:D-alanyl-D-alanine carboxypeptidase [Streptomyces pharetrae CZA14]
MAGESPDRSKQRESSAEPTSGSAGPVPEARREADDPRLAVARAGVDTATRILSAKDLAEARKGAAEAAGTKDDEELRATVAAWVRTADESPSGEAERAEGEAEAGAGSRAEAEDGEGDTRSGGEAESEDVADAGADADAGAEDSEKAGADAEDADERAADAKAEDADADTDTDTDTDTDGSVTDAKADADTDAADSEEAGAGAESASAPEDADADESGTDAGPDGREPAEGAESAGSGKDDTGTGKATRDTEKGSSGAGKDAGKGSSRAGSDDAPVDQPTTVFKAVRPPKPAVDQPTTMLKLGAAAKAKPAEEPKDPKEPKEPGKAPEDSAEPTDSKTSKASKESKGPKESVKDSAKPGGGEDEAERTSTFVALKQLDDPAVRKPRTAAPAKPAERAEPAAPAKPAERARPAAPAGPVVPADVTAAVPQIGPERTTQQPLPPKPPLDLLAELTNTPPPPQTPLRTAVRRVKIWTPLVLLLVVVVAVIQSVRPLPTPTLQLTAEDSYTFDGSKAGIPWPQDGQAALDVQGIGTFGSSGEQKPVPIASVAKVMTAYVILREHPLKSGEEGPMIKIDQAAEEQSDAGQESTVDVFAGDRISEREALESILIASANNVARLLARWDAGAEKDFVAKMNATAKDLGMTNTTYTDPSGLNDTTVSTAVDQVKLAKAAMTLPAFREVAAMMSYDDYKGVNRRNWNELVGSNNVVGIKTGTTTSALGNLVFAAKKDVGGETHTIVGAVVRQPPGGKDNTILQGALSAGDQLIRAAQDALESATILKKGDVVGHVDDGLGGRTPVVVTQDVTAVGWAGLTVKLSFAADELPHTAKAGTKVGTLTVGDGATAGAVKVPVALEDDLAEPGFMDKLTRIG